MNNNTIIIHVPSEDLKEGNLWDKIYDMFAQELIRLNMEHAAEFNARVGFTNDPIRKATNRMMITRLVKSMSGYKVEIKHEDVETGITTLAVSIHTTTDPLTHYQWGDGE